MIQQNLFLTEKIGWWRDLFSSKTELIANTVISENSSLKKEYFNEAHV